MKRSTKIIAALILVVGGSGAVYAYSKHGDWHMSPAEKVEFVTDRVSKKLELTAEQRQNFGSLAETVAQILVDARANKEQHIAEVKGLLQEPSFNQARALELVRQKTEMVNSKAPLVISQLAIFLDSLNTGQKQQLQEFIEHRHKHHVHKHHRHGHDG